MHKKIGKTLLLMGKNIQKILEIDSFDERLTKLNTILIQELKRIEDVMSKAGAINNMDRNS